MVIKAKAKFWDLLLKFKILFMYALINLNLYENGKSYQYFRNDRKRTYKQTEWESDFLQTKNTELLNTIKQLEKVLMVFV